MYRFLDHSILMYLRFNDLHSLHPLMKIFYAWTLFSVDHIDFDQMYMTMKILVPQHHNKVVRFFYPKEQQLVTKRTKGILQEIHDKLCVEDTAGIQDKKKRALEPNHLIEKMNAVGGLNESIYYDEDPQKGKYNLKGESIINIVDQ